MTEPLSREEWAAEHAAYDAAKEAGFPCKGCGKVWTGHSRCHCSGCHESFNSLSAFERHRQDFRCWLPNKHGDLRRGLILSDGYWRRPGERPPPPAHDEFQALEP